MNGKPALPVIAMAVSLTALIAAVPALAADIDVSSRIRSVTVYPDAAQVVRVAEVELPQGASSLVFKGLPYRLDPNSLRIAGEGGAQISIGSVQSRTTPASVSRGPNSLAVKLRELNDQRNLVRQRLAALNARKQMIERYAKASPEKLGEKSAPMDVGKWSSAWEAVGQGLVKVAEESQAAQFELREIREKIRALRASNRGPAAGSQPRREVTVEIDAAAAAKGRITLTYRVSGASWRPVYDARLATGTEGGKPQLELVRRASVSQRTGEDWSGVVLSVSTVRARRGTQAPDLLAQKVQFREEPKARPAPAPREQNAYRRDRAAAPKVTGRAGGLLSGFSAKPAVEREADIVASGYEAQFRIPGKVNIPADGSTRAVRIGTEKITPRLTVKSVPVLDRTAYLEVAFKNTGKAALLPGRVNIQRDGMFVGRGRIKLVPPGDEAQLGFGADDQVKITRVPVNRKEGGPGWFGNDRAQVNDYRITAKNLHPFAVKVQIIGRKPISENDQITVEGLPTNTVANIKTVEDRRGVFGWSFDLKPGESKEIRNGWRIKWPKDKRIMTRNVAN